MSEQQQPRKSVAESLRNQPIRKSLVGGVKTRQPDYEQRHLEMMRYLSNLKHGKENENFRGNLPSSSSSSTQQQQPIDPKQLLLRGFHQAEIERLLLQEQDDQNNARRKYKKPSSLDDMDERKKHILLSAQSHLRDIDPATGLPRQNLSTMGLKNHPGMEKISPWMILYQYIRQIFRSKLVLVVVLGFVLLLNFRRFAVLFQIHHNIPNKTSTNVDVEQEMKVEV